MCFKAPQVFDSFIEYRVKTMVAVLSWLSTCKAVRFQKSDFLLVGSGISTRDGPELIRDFAKLNGHGAFHNGYSLLYAVVKGVALASCSHIGLEMTPILDVKSIGGGSLNVSRLLCHFPRDISLKIEKYHSDYLSTQNWIRAGRFKKMA